MPIIWPYSSWPSSYVSAGQQVVVPPQRCPACQRPLVGWCGYWRWLRAPLLLERIWIRRARCSACRRSDALLPDLVLARRLDAVDGIGRRLASKLTLIDGVGYEPRVVITDKLTSYPPAIRRVLPNVDHRRHKGLNNRAENSHLPVRKRERMLQRFKSTEHVQNFLSVFGPIGNHFRPRRHRLSAIQYRLIRTERFATWRQAVGLHIR